MNAPIQKSALVSAMRAVDLTISGSFFDGHRDTIPKPFALTWPAFVATVKARFKAREDKFADDAGGFNLATFGERDGKDSKGKPFEDGRRTNRDNKHVDVLNGVVLDFDKNYELGRVFDGLKGIAHLAYTTFQHTHDAPRWRVVVPTSRALTPKEFSAVRAQLVIMLTGEPPNTKRGADEQAKAVSNFYFAPGCPAAMVEHAEWRVSDDDAIVWTPQTVTTPIARVEPKKPATMPGTKIDWPGLEAEMANYRKDAEVRRAFRAVLKGERFADHGARNTMLLRMCGVLAYRAPNAKPEELAQKFAASLAVMEAEHPEDPPPSLDMAADMIARAQAKLGAQAAERASEHGADNLSVVEGAAPTAAKREHLTDSTNAERLVRLFGGDLRYSTGTGWLAWDGARFAFDGEATAQRFAKETARSIYKEALKKEDDERPRFVKWALACESRERRNAMVALASYEKSVRIDAADALDTDPFAFNVHNGTIDLRTGRLREHQREDLITKLSPVVYDVTATCPMWIKFLNEVLGGNRDLISYIQHAVGYSLTGSVSGDALFFAHGNGQNGKSTFAETIMELCGEYAKAAPPELLIAKKNDAHPTELADLFGARLVVAQEVEDDQRFAEAKIKRLTGKDRIKGRFMGKDFIEFKPTHKLWLCANHKPEIRGTDLAIWRRIKLLPFTVTITKKDEKLPAKLLTELPGILNWAIEGCLAWQAHGLQEPPAVVDATNAYRKDMDNVGKFIDECCTFDASARTSAKDLYAEYKRWVESRGDLKLSQKRLGDKLAERPELQKTKSNGSWWNGIRLNARAGAFAQTRAPIDPVMS